MQNKFLLSFIVLFMLHSAANAASVSVQSAQAVALNFYKVTVPDLNDHITLTAQLKYTQTEADNSVDFYVFDIQPVKGFVIVSAQDAVIPVLGYSTESYFITGFQQVGLINWVNKVSNRIHQDVTQHIQADERISGLWTAYANGQKPASERSGAVTPLCVTTWDQSPNYNADCPTTGGHLCVTGCVATAMAQIMKFWNYPVKGTGSYTYTDNVANHDQFNIGQLTADFGTTTYAWTQMPNSVTSSNSAVATLMVQAGVSVNMDYGDQESGAYVTQAEANQAYGYTNAPCAQYAYVNYFNYNSSTIQGLSESSYSASAWTTLIENELNDGRPVEYEGYDASAGGHTWVCDGYNASNDFHMNWGWSGQNDGYYAINNLDPSTYVFSEQDGAIIGIEPVNTPPVAALSASVTTSCNGTIQFTDNSSGDPTSWLWNFGDGTTSTLQNPVHTYNSNGTYAVTLTATNNYGSNEAAISPDITISRPAAPSATGATKCSASTFSLSASTSNPVTWLDSSGNVVSSSNPFVTPTLSATTTYWVFDSMQATQYNAGPASKSIGSGGYLNVAHNLIFNVTKAGTLVSVYVYASGAGSRTFQMTNASGVILNSATVSLPNGGSTVTLNFNLPLGGPYYLGPTGSDINLYRNETGAAYPYSDPDGIVSITGNDAGGVPAYYYYCYNWVVQEPNCISLPAPATATVSGITSFSPTISAVSCFGGANGSAAVSVSGGTPSYTYNWSNSQTTSSISNLTAGTYTVTVKDASGCSASQSEIVGQPASALAATVTPTSVSCFGGTTGSVIAAASGGTANYTFNWGNATGFYRTGLAAGTYNVTVTDAHSCTVAATGTITQPSLLTVQTTVVNAGCGESSTGSATAVASGGTSGYTYLWNTNATTATISNLSASTYNVTVTDAHSCTVAAPAVVSGAGSLNATPSATNIACFGAATGSATVVVTGATAPVTYLWSDNATTTTISNLAAGTYYVTVTDAHNCSVVATQAVTQPAQLMISVTASNAACGVSNGSISASPSGGTGGYTYLWTDNATTAALNNLPAGNYGLTVTDAHGCVADTAATIISASSLVANLNAAGTTCFDSATGSASVSVVNGSSPYNYLWSNGNTTASIAGVVAGSYMVTITDVHSCISVDTLVVVQPSQLTLTVTASQPQCPGIIYGSAAATAGGGTPGYTILWSNNGAGSNAGALAAGSYSVTVTDLNHCSMSSSFLIDTVAPINPNAVVTAALCYDSASGSAQLSPTGGTPPYHYAWSNGQSGQQQANDLAAGNYNVTITDGHNCLFSTQISITQPDEMQITTASTPATGQQNNGQASVESVSGGTSPYTGYNWSDGQTTQTATNLAAGTYPVTVTDSHGCQQTASVTVNGIATGLNAVTQNIQFKVYPNPAQTEAWVLLNSAEDGAIINVRNILGQLLFTTPVTLTQTKLDLSNYANGVYMIEVIHGDTKGVAELIVSR